ncbi:hypothetical protein BDN70DRAFT_989488, partial [Pholiota conissans]
MVNLLNKVSYGRLFLLLGLARVVSGTSHVAEKPSRPGEAHSTLSQQTSSDYEHFSVSEESRTKKDKTNTLTLPSITIRTETALSPSEKLPHGPTAAHTLSFNPHRSRPGHFNTRKSAKNPLKTTSTFNSPTSSPPNYTHTHFSPAHGQPPHSRIDHTSSSAKNHEPSRSPKHTTTKSVGSESGHNLGSTKTSATTTRPPLHIPSLPGLPNIPSIISSIDSIIHHPHSTHAKGHGIRPPPSSSHSTSLPTHHTTTSPLLTTAMGHHHTSPSSVPPPKATHNTTRLGHTHSTHSTGQINSEPHAHEPKTTSFSPPQSIKPHRHSSNPPSTISP